MWWHVEVVISMEHMRIMMMISKANDMDFHLALEMDGS